MTAEPTLPQQMATFAELFVNTHPEEERHKWDYSTRSVTLLDELTETFRRQGNRSDAMQGFVTVAGAYLGEIAVRHHGASWIDASQQPEDGAFVVEGPVLRLSEGAMTSPHAKVAKRLDNGPEDDLAFYFAMLTGQPSGGSRPTNGTMDQPEQKTKSRGGFLSGLFGRRTS